MQRTSFLKRTFGSSIRLNRLSNNYNYNYRISLNNVSNVKIHQRNIAISSIQTIRNVCLSQQRNNSLQLRSFSSSKDEYPDHELMGLPALSPTMDKGNIIKWHKKEGDSIVAGDIIVDIETDKAVMELEAQDDVVLAKILMPEGSQNVQVGEPIAVTVEDPSSVDAFKNYSSQTVSEEADNDVQQPLQSGESASQEGDELPDGFELLGLPALSPTMEQGSLVEWKMEEGATFTAGDIIATVETDKATMDFEVQEDGVLAKKLKSEGAVGILVGEPIAVIAVDGADLSNIKDYEYSEKKPAETPKEKEQPKQKTEQKQEKSTQKAQKTTASSSSASSGDRIAVSPLARRLLKEKGISAEQLAPGSGPGGRIIAVDVQNADLSNLKQTKSSSSAVSSTSSTDYSNEDFDETPHSNIRRVTAQRLTESKQQVPHYYVTMEMKVDSLLQLRKRAGANGDKKPSLNDFVIKAAAVALRKVPEVNCSWTDETIRNYHNVDIAVAVATDRGLLTPIVHDADLRGV